MKVHERGHRATVKTIAELPEQVKTQIQLFQDQPFWTDYANMMQKNPNLKHVLPDPLSREVIGTFMREPDPDLKDIERECFNFNYNPTTDGMRCIAHFISETKLGPG